MTYSNNKPIIIFDMDGTLIDHENIVHPKDMALLAMPNPPAIFVPATGRSLFALRRIMQVTGLWNGDLIPYPLICQNGAFVYDLGEQRIHSALFDVPEQQKILAACKSMTNTCFLIFDEKEMRILHPSAFGLDESERYLLDHKEYSDDEPYVPYSKVMCLSDDPQVFKQFIEKIEDVNVEVATSTRTILEVNPAGVDKAVGIEVLLKYKQWDRNNVFTAGDGENDISMLSHFENSFSPTTSPKHIQSNAKNIIDTSIEGLLTPIIDFAMRNK